MSVTGIVVLLLFIVGLSGWYVYRQDSFKERDPTLLLMIPFFMILFMVGYVMTLEMKSNVERIFLPIK